MTGTIKGAVLILDAAGCIGRAVVEAALGQSRPVIAVATDVAPLDALRLAHPGADLTVLMGSAANEAAALALVEDVRMLARPLAGIVLGNCREPIRARVLDQGMQALRDRFDDEVLPQLAAAAALVPLLAEAGRNGSYVLIGGPGGEQPWAGYGHHSICAAATRMLMRVLHDEAHALSVRVHQLAVEMPARTTENGGRACEQWPSASDIARRALELIEPTDSRTPIEAVVRFAWNAAGPAPNRRARTADRPGVGPTVLPKSPVIATPTDPAPIPNLDDTWARLQPLLANNSSKGSKT